MMFSTKTKYKAKRIFPFGIIWLVVGVIFLTVEHLALGDQNNALDTAVQLDTQIAVFALTVITIIGLIFGIIEVLVLKKLFKNKSFRVKFLGKFSIYLVFFLIVILITYPIAVSIELDLPVFHSRVWDKYIDFFFSITHLSAMIQLSFSLLLSLIYSEINDNLGGNVLYNFLTGKYHKPVVENRIFMFLDMKDSTSIAEKLGHKNYFLLLRDYYRIFSNAIIENRGEVYQYVGDEIVITWQLQNGIKNTNCIKCFFDMKKALTKAENNFKSNFGLVPDFKAAIHCGLVTTGEIGALKKDIFFTGDVLNTTARILSFTSEFDEDLLISERLSKQLDLSKQFKIIEKGSHQLKGKIDRVNIMAVHK